MKSVAIVSGGMDSVTLLYQHKDSISHVLNFTYGSKHNQRETAFAELHAHRLGKVFKRIDLAFIGETFKSDLLLSGGTIPHGHYADESMRSTVVPFRNGIMLSIAAGFAESNGCSCVKLANHFGDHAIYPDCRGDFIKGMREAIRCGTYNEIEIESPYCDISKKHIAAIGQELGLDYRETYSCYEGDEVHCGECGTCVERKEALEGFDLTVYKK